MSNGPKTTGQKGCGQPERMGCVVLSPEEGRMFMDMLERGKQSGELVEIASTDDD